MNFGEAITTCFKKSVTFKGRARRSEFWWFNLSCGLFSSILGLIPKVGIFFSLIVVLPWIAVTMRRLQDIGKSGWNYLWIIIPIIGPILVLIWFCRDSQPGENQYGPNPKGIGNHSDQIQDDQKE